jgi:hypothetical protein
MICAVCGHETPVPPFVLTIRPAQLEESTVGFCSLACLLALDADTVLGAVRATLEERVA